MTDWADELAEAADVWDITEDTGPPGLTEISLDRVGFAEYLRKHCIPRKVVDQQMAMYKALMNGDPRYAAMHDGARRGLGAIEHLLRAVDEGDDDD